MDITNRACARATEAKGRRLWPLLATTRADMVLIDMDAGTATNRHWHAKTEEFFYVIEGEGRVETQDGDQPTVIRPIREGDAFVMPLGTAHRIYADSHLTLLKFDVPGFDPADAHTEGPR